MSDKDRTTKTTPPPTPRSSPETLQRQVEILKQLGASSRIIESAERTIEAAKKT